MKRSALKIAPSQSEDRADPNDHAAMSVALNRLYRAATNQVGGIVADLMESERAKLAVFCYGRAHLNTIVLAVAAHCGLDHLTAASGSATAGRTLYTQSRELPAAPQKTYSNRRSVTLATSVSEGFASRAATMPAELSA